MNSGFVPPHPSDVPVLHYEDERDPGRSLEYQGPPGHFRGSPPHGAPGTPPHGPPRRDEPYWNNHGQHHSPNWPGSPYPPSGRSPDFERRDNHQGPSLCGDCEKCSHGNSSGCEVCDAAASPSPAPVNPLGNGKNLGMGILPVQQRNLAPLQNAFQEFARRQQQQQQTRSDDPGIIAAKVIFFHFIMIWTTWAHGLCVTTWTIGILTLLAARLSFPLCIAILLEIQYIMMIAGLWYYFYHALAFVTLANAIDITSSHLHWTISLSIGIGWCYFVVVYLESIFIQRVLLQCIVGVMVDIYVRA